MIRPSATFQLSLFLLLLLSCQSKAPVEQAHSSTSQPTATASTPPPSPPRELVLIVGGDVSFGRMRGRRLLREPKRNDFAPLQPLLDQADVRFINLESILHDRGGQTQSPHNPLVFNAPAQAAQVLKQAKIEVVSLANNHAWDYGRSGLLETFTHLEKAGIAYTGAGRDRAAAYAPRIVKRKGMTLAFLAFTSVWNQALSPHPGKAFIADAEPETMLQAVRQARARSDVDKLIVSFHGGEEYLDQPYPDTQRLLAEVIHAGADVVIGHHPHVLQRVDFVDGKPVLYSLGNLLMRMVNGRPWTEHGALGRIRLRRAGKTTVELCLFRMSGLDPITLGRDPKRAIYQKLLEVELGRLQRDGAGKLGAFDAEGCVEVRAASGE